jgi:hypothetical protein
MLVTQKLTLGTSLLMSLSAQDATPAFSALILGDGFFGPFSGSISLTAGAELCAATQKQFCLQLFSLPPEFLQVYVTR